MRRFLTVLDLKTPVVSASGRAADLFFRSDTLSAALTSALAGSGVEVDGEDRLAANPPFRVSSALPVLRQQDGAVCVFFPVPDVCKVRPVGGLDRKAAKQVLYADAVWLAAVLDGRAPERGRTIAQGPGELVLQDWSDRGRTPLAVVGTRTGLAVDRWTGGPIESLLFEVTDVFVVGGLFRLGVVMECDDSFQGGMVDAFRVLGLAGVGSRRTTGRGQFDVEGCFDFTPPDLGRGHHLLLSLYHPTREEWASGRFQQSSYRLEQRGGFVTSPGAMTLRRRRVAMIAEGALVHGTEPPVGDVVCVLDPAADPAPGLRHPVYRDGRAVSIEAGFRAR